jgi:hypothetical protein
MQEPRPTRHRHHQTRSAARQAQTLVARLAADQAVGQQHAGLVVGQRAQRGLAGRGQRVGAPVTALEAGCQRQLRLAARPAGDLRVARVLPRLAAPRIEAGERRLQLAAAALEDTGILTLQGPPGLGSVRQQEQEGSGQQAAHRAVSGGHRSWRQMGTSTG